MGIIENHVLFVAQLGVRIKKKARRADGQNFPKRCAAHGASLIMRNYSQDSSASAKHTIS
jgi:hypothetical protein